LSVRIVHDRLLVGMLGQRQGRLDGVVSKATGELSSHLQGIRRQQHMLCLLLTVGAHSAHRHRDSGDGERGAIAAAGVQRVTEDGDAGVMLTVLDLWHRMYHDVSHCAIQLHSASA
jgi:hypothetical protein